MTPSKNDNGRQGISILGAFIDALSWRQATETITDWALQNESRYVCLCNVHSLTTAGQDAQFLAALNNADMTTADGMPVAWYLRRSGFTGQKRINGPDLMWRLCETAARQKLGIFLYGSTPETLSKLHTRIRSEFEDINIAGVHSPPFRKTSPEENRQIIDTINRSGAKIVFVGLGCPKQEKWMAANRGRIRAVLVGVGAAFDFHAGLSGRAPVWMQHAGLEWAHRLGSEPRRLWRRYILGNSRFIMMLGRDWMERRKSTG